MIRPSVFPNGELVAQTRVKNLPAMQFPNGLRGSQILTLPQTLGGRNIIIFDDYISREGSQVLEKDIPGWLKIYPKRAEK